MKLQVKFKTPDAVDYAIEREGFEEKDDAEVEALQELANQYVEYGEYITIEFDTETQTATVIKVEK